MTVRLLLRISIPFVVVLIGLMMTSCLPGSSVGKRYVRQKQKESISMLSADFLFKENLNTGSIEGYKKMDSLQKDSARYYNSIFVQHIEDSVFLTAFYQGMYDVLTGMGYKVFTESEMQDFLLQENAWMVSIAQQGVEEYAYPFYQRGDFEDTTVYSEGINVNGFVLNTWIEISQLNGNQPMEVVFNPTTFEDRIMGDFQWNPFTDEYPYNYSRSDIVLSDLNLLAMEAGRENAGLLLDYFLNNYINSRRKTKLSKENYLHYDLQQRKFRLAKQERYIKLTP